MLFIQEIYVFATINSRYSSPRFFCDVSLDLIFEKKSIQLRYEIPNTEVNPNVRKFSDNHHIKCYQGSGLLVPGMVFSVPGGFRGSQGVFSSRAGVFSVPRFGFAVPGMVCWAPVGVFCSRNGVSGSRPEGTAWRCLWFPYGVSSCFFLLLCFSLFVASFLSPSFFSFSHFLLFLFPFLRSCLPPSLSPPALPLIFLRSSLSCFLPLLPSHPFPFRFVPFQNSLPVPSLPFSNAFPRPFPSLP